MPPDNHHHAREHDIHQYLYLLTADNDVTVRNYNGGSNLDGAAEHDAFVDIVRAIDEHDHSVIGDALHNGPSGYLLARGAAAGRDVPGRLSDVVDDMHRPGAASASDTGCDHGRCLDALLDAISEWPGNAINVSDLKYIFATARNRFGD
jgi:hypothetical protein